MKVAITGSSGYIGKHLVSYLLKENYYVLGMQRDTLKETKKLKFLHYDLLDNVGDDKLKGVDVIIHCAFMEFISDKTNSDLINLNAAKTLISACHKSGVKIIYLSTFSAHEDAQSHYGISKFKLENVFKAAGNTVVRLGIVVSPDGGMFPQMLDTINSSKILPLINGGHQPMQFIDIKQLCRVIIRIIHYKGDCNEFNIGSSDFISMQEFYNKMARKLNLHRYEIYIPIWVMFAAFRLSKMLGVNLPFNKENLLGLKAMRHFETKTSLGELEIPVFFTKDVFESYFDKTRG
jgi:nucleoside-diphosphate-sugar epimerase